MKFRPCIDIHNGKVKQIVGGSLLDKGNQAVDNFVSEQDAGYYGKLYQKGNLAGGHIIILNPAESEYYDVDVKQAELALKNFPGGLQIGGGMNAENAEFFLNLGATHVIVTSYVFKNGEINFKNLYKLVQTVGKERLVLDLSCRKKDGKYFIVTDRWQKFTNVEMNVETLDQLSSCCDEFLIHAVDVEGKARGVEEGILKLLGEWNKIPITYAGGVADFSDLDKVKTIGKNHVDVTIGSALDIFGGQMKFEEVLEKCSGK